jgi:hypothetical protein
MAMEFSRKAVSWVFLTACCKLRFQVSGVRFQQLKNHKYQNTNTKWFDKLTTTLSQVEGQITMIEIQNHKQLTVDLV